jgi:hypothetical protein
VSSTTSPTVRCATHGEQQRTRVCQHIVNGLTSKTRVGFFWTTFDPQNARPDAWCLDCENRVRKTGGDWVDDAVDQLKPQVLCGACYDHAKRFHMGESEWS